MEVDHFRAMGSDASVLVVGGPPRLNTLARLRIAELEARWSRFIPSSEVTRLNEAAGDAALVVSSDTFELVSRAIEGWRATHGLFDPTVLGDVLRAGYTTNFDDLGPEPVGADTGLVHGCERILVDRANRTVFLPPGVGFDPGGLGKGLAADLVVSELLDAGAEGAFVNLGGDVRVAGTSPAGSWTVAIEDPFSDAPAVVVFLTDGGVATSSRLRRQWVGDSGPAHHLIDPRSGISADTGLATASAVARTAWQAEVLAKAAFLAGPVGGMTVFDDLHAAGLLITDQGDVLRSETLDPFIVPDLEDVAG
jgi:thiamine biosynthesis lipoprotein